MALKKAWAKRLRRDATNERPERVKVAGLQLKA